jgi:hypothetical protein
LKYIQIVRKYQQCAEDVHKVAVNETFTLRKDAGEQSRKEAPKHSSGRNDGYLTQIWYK